MLHIYIYIYDISRLRVKIYHSQLKSALSGRHFQPTSRKYVQFCFKASSFINMQTTTTNTQAATNVIVQAEPIDKRITFVRDLRACQCCSCGFKSSEQYVIILSHNYRFVGNMLKRGAPFDKCIIQCVSFTVVLSNAAVTVRHGECRPSTRKKAAKQLLGLMERGDTEVICTNLPFSFSQPMTSKPTYLRPNSILLIILLYGVSHSLPNPAFL